MEKDITSATRKDLQAIRPADQVSFFLDLSINRENHDDLKCETIIRCLPGRRLAFIGQWRGQKVFTKLFFDSKRAEIHWRREQTGVRALKDKGIRTPGLIYSQFHVEEKIYFLIFEYIESSGNLADAWNESTDDRKQELLVKLIEVLIEHHCAGILQSDLHLENFLLAGESIYTLDGAGVVSGNQPLIKKGSLLNLANLFAQFDAEYDRWLGWAFGEYARARQWPVTREGKDQLARLIKCRRAARKNYILNKSTRECSAFVCQKSWRQFTVIDRRYDSENLRVLLAAPDRYIADTELIKNGNTSTVTKVRIDNRDILIKRYNIKNFKHALSRCFRYSRAWRAWRNSQRLLFYGIETPLPIALVESRWGPFRRKAYFLTQFVDGVDAMTFFQTDHYSFSRKQIVAERLTRLLEKLRSARISHGDLKATNFLVCGSSVSLIDLDSMKEHRDESGFRKAWAKDIRRFLKNWTHCQEVMGLFQKQFGAI